MSACYCCDTPDCGLVGLQSESFSVSKSKCGFFVGGVYYRKRVTVVSRSGEDQYTNSSGNGSCTTTLRSDSTKTSTSEYPADCAGGALGSCVGSGSTSKTEAPSGSGTCAGDACSGTFDPCVENWPPSCPVDLGLITSRETSYSEPDTTGELESRASAALEAVAATGTGYLAFRNLSSDENSLTITKFRYKIQHPPTASCYLKVWSDRVFTPEGGGEAVVTADLDPYTWIGTGNPCFPDPGLPERHADNRVESGWYNVDVPEADGTIYLRRRRSCLAGYEPEFTSILGETGGWPPPPDA